MIPLFVFQIVDNQSEVRDLPLRKSVGIHAFARVHVQKIIGRNSEEAGELHEHFDGGLNVVVLPIRNALLAYVELACKLHLTDSPRKPQFFDVFVEHIRLPVDSMVNYYDTIVQNYLTNIKILWYTEN